MDFHLICFAAENVSDETGFANATLTIVVPLVVTVTPATEESDETVSAIGLPVSIVISISVMLFACSIIISEPWYNLIGLQQSPTFEVDFEGFKDGVAFEGGKGENYPLTIGSGQFIPGFEDQLIGKNIGEDVEVNVTFPENYQAEELAGQPALFKVVIKEIKEKQLPEYFKQDFNVLIVADKYQTGFDQPKLCAMYVDKKLRGVSAVQTLSRLNRICAPYDKKTFVLDFKNEYEDIQKSFAPFYTETVLAETITPSDIRAVEAQIDQYNFLDIDDIDLFNEYLYRDKRLARDKAKMWSLLDKSLQIINKYTDLEKMEIRATIKRFIRFYSFLIQATCYESVDLHKKYNFLTYLVKEIEVGGGGNDFDIADKITASNFKQAKTGDTTHDIESEPEVALPKPNPVYIDEQVKKKLSEIIDEINSAYNKNFDPDVASKSALQMRDLLLKNGHLRDSARNNSLRDFKFAYFDAVQDALLDGYEQNQDFFALLLDNEERKREIMQVFLEDVYKQLREE